MKHSPSSTGASGLEDHLGYWLRLVSNQVSLSFAKKVEGHGTTVAEWVIMRTMLDGEEVTSPSKVALDTGLSRGAVSKLLDRLFSKGLVNREGSAEDRRYQKICLTKQAIELVPKLAALADANDEQFFSALTAKDRRELRRILTALGEANKIKQVPIK